MIKNYFKIAWRNLLKDSKSTLLNVLGLSAGLACVLLIYLWVNDELSFDKFFANDDQLYQVMEYRKVDGELKVSDESSGLVSEVLLNQMPEVQNAAVLVPSDWFQKFTLSVNDKNIKAIGQYAGKDYFNVFSFKILEGNKSTMLNDKNAIVISDELAKKLFGTTDNIIGKPIVFQHDTTFFVSGIFEKVPYHSTQQFDFVLSFDYYASVQGWVKTWNNTGPHNFVLLKKGTDINTFNKKIENIVAINSKDTTRSLFAAKFSENYLLNSFDHGSQVGSKIVYVKLFSIIALFILIIACINFMNLSTAKASKRMKEVGIKKVIGATRLQLIFQFLSESILLTFFAMGLSILIVKLLLPYFNQLTDKRISLVFEPKIVLTFLFLGLTTGLLAGGYPAFFLSKFKPLTIVKGKLSNSFAEAISRKGLVVFQFTLSSVLIIGVIIIYQQIQFIQSSTLGYNKENIIRFDTEGRLLGNEETFMTELKKITGVVNTAYTFHNIVGRNFGTNGLEWEGKDPNSNVYFEGVYGSDDFIKTMGMQLEEGRPILKGFGDVNREILLNETAVKVMHLQNPVGKTIRINNTPHQIVGIVKDFHFESLHEPVKPAYLKSNQGGNTWNKMMVRISPENQQETIVKIQQLYESFNAGFPFTYSFLDEAYQKQYHTETIISTLSKYFAGLAILISCLGLFGLVAFTAQRRQKEIGIRKVLGASVLNIIGLISKDFLILVGMAILIACPIAYYFMSKWLQSFAYRIDISWWIFFLAGVMALLIALLTVSFQAIKAAVANPVKSLRAE